MTSTRVVVNEGDNKRNIEIKEIVANINGVHELKLTVLASGDIAYGLINHTVDDLNITVIGVVNQCALFFTGEKKYVPLFNSMPAAKNLARDIVAPLIQIESYLPPLFKNAVSRVLEAIAGYVKLMDDDEFKEDEHLAEFNGNLLHFKMSTFFCCANAHALLLTFETLYKLADPLTAPAEIVLLIYTIHKANVYNFAGEKANTTRIPLLIENDKKIRPIIESYNTDEACKALVGKTQDIHFNTHGCANPSAIKGDNIFPKVAAQKGEPEKNGEADTVIVRGRGRFRGRGRGRGMGRGAHLLPPPMLGFPNAMRGGFDPETNNDYQALGRGARGRGSRGRGSRGRGFGGGNDQQYLPQNEEAEYYNSMMLQQQGGAYHQQQEQQKSFSNHHHHQDHHHQSNNGYNQYPQQHQQNSQAYPIPQGYYPRY